jgi:hypothetical protein
MKRSAILLTCLVCGCSPKAAEVLPQEAAGWTRSSQVRIFRAEDLWRYVDGDAERYLRAGIRRTVTASYRRPDGIEAVADAHEMKNAAAARGIFESEQQAGSRPLDVGDQGRLYGQMLTFHRSGYFVRLTAYQDSPNVGEALTGLAKDIDSRIPRRQE